MISIKKVKNFEYIIVGVIALLVFSLIFTAVVGITKAIKSRDNQKECETNTATIVQETTENPTSEKTTIETTVEKTTTEPTTKTVVVQTNKTENIETTKVTEKTETTEKTENIESTETTDKPQYTSLGTFKLTAYCACSKCCGKWAGSPTASGAMPKANHTIAVDTSVIPFGTKVMIDGFGTYVAEDTGSAIKGNKIDIFFADHQTAWNFGVQYAEVFIVNE